MATKKKYEGTETDYLLSGKNREVLIRSIKELKFGEARPHKLIEE